MSGEKESLPTPESGRSEDYKLVVYRSEDFQEVRSFNLSLSSIYILCSTVILILCILIFSLLSFTPLKNLVPGYGKIESNEQFMRLVDGVDDIALSLESQGVYIAALRTLLKTGLSASNQASPEQVIVDTDNELTNNYSTDVVFLPNLSATQNQDIGIRLSDDSELYDALIEQKVRVPVNGLISSEFDPTIKHFGVDVLAPAQTSVISMMDGFVFSSGWDLETGYSIGVQHANNILSFYKHNSQLLKEKGTFVRAGEAIAIIGNTGTLSNGPHLHFEIWHNGKPVNPEDILKFD